MRRSLRKHQGTQGSFADSHPLPLFYPKALPEQTFTILSENSDVVVFIGGRYAHFCKESNDSQS